MANPRSQSAPAVPPRWWTYLPPVGVLLLWIVILHRLSPNVWLVLLSDGLYVLMLLASAAGFGYWPLTRLIPRRQPVLRVLLLSIGLGLGIMALFTLLLGIAGWLPWTAKSLVATGWALALVRLAQLTRQSVTYGSTEPPERRSTWWPIARALLLSPLAVPLAVVFFGATLPPGTLWGDEAFGYDALEYHLQGPREYFDAGRITFLPHNVYASFPQQMEMLYLLLMHVMGSPLAGAIPAQLLHACCGVLAVLTLWAWLAPGWPRVVAVLVAGSVPWLAYLGCLAYVELGVVYFAALSAGVLLAALDEAQGGDAPGVPWRRFVLAGLLAGLTAGCKYTAVVLVPAAMTIALLLVARGPARLRAARAGVFALAGALAFCPWLIRNASFTGNPVYPFAYGWFGGNAWSDEQARQWAVAHQLPASQADLATRLAIAWSEFPASGFWGPALFLFALAGLVAARSRAAAMLALWAALGLLSWMIWTHMPGRFLVPLIVPLAFLIGGLPVRLTAGAGRRWWPAACCVCGFAGAIVGDLLLLGLYGREHRRAEAERVSLRDRPGLTDIIAEIHPLSSLPKDRGTVWLVGEARAFYMPRDVHYTVPFSRDPWLRHAGASSPADAVRWLRTHDVSHLVFSWSEIERLQGTYGFPGFVTRTWLEDLARAGLRAVALPQPNNWLDVYEVLPEGVTED